MRAIEKGRIDREGARMKLNKPTTVAVAALLLTMSAAWAQDKKAVSPAEMD